MSIIEIKVSYLYFFPLKFWCDFGEKVWERSFSSSLTGIWSNFWLPNDFQFHFLMDNIQ